MEQRTINIRAVLENGHTVDFNLHDALTTMGTAPFPRSTKFLIGCGGKDEDGQEAFEGDLIIGEDNCMWELFYSDDQCRFFLGKLDKEGDPVDGCIEYIDDDGYGFQPIIGNAHANPELRIRNRMGTII